MSARRSRAAPRQRRAHGRTILVSALAGVVVLGLGVGPRGIPPLLRGSRAAAEGVRAELSALAGRLGGRPEPGSAAAGDPAADQKWAAAVRDIKRIASQAGGTVTLAWRELGGSAPRSYALGGDRTMFAGSTYKLPLLVAEAQAVSTGRAAAEDTICFRADDYEAGWFDDYQGGCFTREQLSERIGLFSDNTAGHMLTRDLGGPDALNAAARGLGATGSVFFTDNTTTANDLAAIITGVGSRRTLDARGFQWLQPKLTNTQFESGVPAGVTPPAQVLHKVGEYGSVTNDAALVLGGRSGPYVLVVCSDGAGGGGDAAWPVIQQLSARVWAYEQAR